MEPVNSYTLLLFGHLIGDFLLQTRWMADNKQKRMLPLVVHSLVYTLSVYGVSWLLMDEPIGMLATAIVFATHVALDQGLFIRFWAKHITRSDDPKLWWLKVIYDQIFHLFVLYGILFL